MIIIVAIDDVDEGTKINGKIKGTYKEKPSK
jgi:hypothetical protein